MFLGSSPPPTCAGQGPTPRGPAPAPHPGLPPPHMLLPSSRQLWADWCPCPPPGETKLGVGWPGAVNGRLASGDPSSGSQHHVCFQGHVPPPAHFLGNLGHFTRNQWRVIVIDAVNSLPPEAPRPPPRGSRAHETCSLRQMGGGAGSGAGERLAWTLGGETAHRRTGRAGLPAGEASGGLRALLAKTRDAGAPFFPGPLDAGPALPAAFPQLTLPGRRLPPPPRTRPALPGTSCPARPAAPAPSTSASHPHRPASLQPIPPRPRRPPSASLGASWAAASTAGGRAESPSRPDPGTPGPEAGGWQGSGSRGAGGGGAAETGGGVRTTGRGGPQGGGR